MSSPGAATMGLRKFAARRVGIQDRSQVYIGMALVRSVDERIAVGLGSLRQQVRVVGRRTRSGTWASRRGRDVGPEGFPTTAARVQCGSRNSPGVCELGFICTVYVRVEFTKMAGSKSAFKKETLFFKSYYSLGWSTIKITKRGAVVIVSSSVVRLRGKNKVRAGW
jgi:hypothetical protein